MIALAQRHFARSVARQTNRSASGIADKPQKGVTISLDTEEQLLAFLQKEGLAVIAPKQETDSKVDMKALERRQAKLEKSMRVEAVAQKIEQSSDLAPHSQLSKQDKDVLRNFSTADPTLNNHVLGNIPMKLVDFRVQKNYEMLKIKVPDSKKQHYEQMLDKLRIMFDVTYTTQDFAKLKMYSLNSDQLLALMQSENFLKKADVTRHVDCLKAIQKSRQLKSYKDRPELMSLVTELATNQSMLTQMKESYVTALAHAISKMRIDDEVIWFSLAEHLSKHHDFYNIRDLSTFTYALTNVSRFKPVLLNFDDLYRKLELQFVKKFDSEPKVTGQDIAITLTSYSKSQNGSLQFWRAMEAIVFKNCQKMNGQELSNVIYSYYKAENSEPIDFFVSLKPRVKEILHKMKPVELCQILMAFTECDSKDRQLMDDDLIEMFQVEFKGRYEAMNPIDSSTFYYCFTKLGHKGDGLFYKYVQKAVTKTIRSFEGPHLRLMFYKFDDLESMRLNRGVRGRLIEHCKWLIRDKQLKGYDAHNIYLHTSKLPYEKPTHQDYTIVSPDTSQAQLDSDENAVQYKYHDLHIQLRNYLERIRYFN